MLDKALVKHVTNLFLNFVLLLRITCRAECSQVEHLVLVGCGDPLASEEGDLQVPEIHCHTTEPVQKLEEVLPRSEWNGQFDQKNCWKKTGLNLEHAGSQAYA